MLPPDGTLEGNAYIDINIIYNKYSNITYDLFQSLGQYGGRGNMCVCGRGNRQLDLRGKSVTLQVRVSMCVCVCVCVKREREREREFIWNDTP